MPYFNLKTNNIDVNIRKHKQQHITKHKFINNYKIIAL